MVVLKDKVKYLAFYWKRTHESLEKCNIKEIWVKISKLMLLWLLYSLICVVSFRNNYFGRGFINELQLQTNIIIVIRFSIWRIWINVAFFSFFLFLFFFLMIYLAVLGLSWDSQDCQPLLWHTGCLVVACKFLVVACGI